MFIEMTGKVFGRLTVIGQAPKIPSGDRMWNVTCSCGNTATVRGALLRSGATTSCGCYRREAAANKTRTHGLSGTSEHGVWSNMMTRCYNQKCRYYARYGGRGIKVCERWHEFKNFFDDMGTRPGNEYTLERKNNDGNYEKDNCVWDTMSVQQRNRSNNKWLTLNGQTKRLLEWADIVGVPARIIRCRIHRKWSVEKALGTSIVGEPISLPPASA